MRVLLATSPGSGTKSVQQLAAAHRVLGHCVEVIDVRELAPAVLGGRLRVQGNWDVVHSRVSATWAWCAQAALESAGLRCANDLASVTAGRDKWVCHLALARAGIRAPDTALLLPGGDASAAVAAVGGYPVVVKPLTGHGGSRVRLCFGDLTSSPAEPLLVQRFHPEAQASDVRVDVVDGKVVARWRRTATAEGEFRANVALGGGETLEPASAALDKLAVDAALACGLTLAGVDVMTTHDGLVVVEVNTNAGVADAIATDGRPVALWHAEAVAAQA